MQTYMSPDEYEVYNYYLSTTFGYYNYVELQKCVQATWFGAYF